MAELDRPCPMQDTQKVPQSATTKLVLDPHDILSIWREAPICHGFPALPPPHMVDIP